MNELTKATLLGKELTMTTLHARIKQIFVFSKVHDF